MTKFIGIASGKGGVGKTTVAINTSIAINNFEIDTTLLDANLSTPHVSIHLGAPLSPITLHNVLKGQNSLTEATYLHSSGLKIIPSSISLDEIDELNPRKLSNLLFKQDLGELVIIDMPSGLTTEVTSLFSVLDELIVVTNADMPSVTEALKTIKLSEKNNLNVKGIVLNNSSSSNILPNENIETILGKKIIAEIPHDTNIKESLKANQPLVYAFPESSASIEFKKLAAKLIGEDYSGSVSTNLFSAILTKLGLK
ncbi:P-loop NTPase [Candidatus Woesearchaeota archaeon]|jgi:septum site-determining protein MinD|nr:P-loop NTPase [Candidatus Woesearchaeota archaeon]